MQEPRIVLITGASAGIGAAIASRLASDGYRVYGTTRKLANPAFLPDSYAMAQAVKTGNPTQYPPRFLELDVTKPESVEKCVKQVIQEAGRIDVLINNAGWGVFGAVEEVPLAMAEDLFQTIVFGSLRMIQAVVPSMRERRSGLIINTSSIAARATLPFQTHYSAAKAALEAFSAGLRQELRPFGVKVVSIEPGDVKTRFFASTIHEKADHTAYQPWSDLCWNYAGKMIEEAPPPSVVSAKFAAVIGKRNPHPIYTCGKVLDRLAPTVFRFLPKRAELFCMRLFYGMGLK